MTANHVAGDNHLHLDMMIEQSGFGAHAGAPSIHKQDPALFHHYLDTFLQVNNSEVTQICLKLGNPSRHASAVCTTTAAACLFQQLASMFLQLRTAPEII